MSNEGNPNRAFYGRKRQRQFRIPRLFVSWLRAAWRHLRVTHLATRVLGPQYGLSPDRIEIDITYRCNLRCHNCNRSIARAPSNLSMSLGDIVKFVEETLAQDRKWKSIRLLGGEPTLHPEFRAILDVLIGYRNAHNPGCSIEVVTNGFGKAVQEQLALVPEDVWIDNSAKTSNVNPGFRPFSTAPVDSFAYRWADYANGCEIMESCGMGLGPLGYYQCAIAAGIDRVAGLGIGLSNLPMPSAQLVEQRCATCRLCGRFKDGHFLDSDLRLPLTEEKMSPTWARMYADYENRTK
jgi:hypothetical protein